MSTARLDRLQRTLTVEKQKDLLANKVQLSQKEPAKFRTLMVDTTNSVTTAILSETLDKVKQLTPGDMPPSHKANARSRDAKKAPGDTTAARSAPHAPASLVTEATKAQSEWALLGRFEADVYQREQKDRLRAKAASKTNQRDALDFQRAQSEAAAAAARAAASEEAEAILADVERYKKEEAIKLAARREYEMQVKTEQEVQLAKISTQREAPVIFQ